MANAQIRLVRKHRVTNQIDSRKPGRPHPDYIYGWQDQNGTFYEGEPFAKSNAAKAPTTQATGASGSLYGEVDRIVQEEVKSRLQKAKAAALEAFNKSLSGV